MKGRTSRRLRAERVIKTLSEAGTWFRRLKPSTSAVDPPLAIPTVAAAYAPLRVRGISKSRVPRV